jgi:hypothetical protein
VTQASGSLTLDSRYAERFTPQPGMQNLRPLPAGVLGPVELLVLPPNLHNRGRL